MGSFRLNTWANCYTYIPSHLFLGEVPQDTYLNTENWAKLRCHCYGPTATFGFLGSGHVKLGSGQVKLVMHMACEEGGAAPCPLGYVFQLNNAKHYTLRSYYELFNNISRPTIGMFLFGRPSSRGISLAAKIQQLSVICHGLMHCSAGSVVDCGVDPLDLLYIRLAPTKRQKYLNLPTFNSSCFVHVQC